MKTTRPTQAHISTHALAANWRLLSAAVAPHASLIAVLKADAYGHGLEICAPALANVGAEWLAVATFEEAIEARRLCPAQRILVLDGLFAGQADEALELKLTPVLWDAWQVELLDAAARAKHDAPGSVPIHIELDTGMNRQGASAITLPALLAMFKSDSPLRIEGVMTHLYAADESDGTVTQAQFAKLDSMLSSITAAGHLPDVFHTGASAAILAELAQQVGQTAARHGMRAALRPGLALYGVVPEFAPDYDTPPTRLASARNQLQPILAWRTAITSIHAIEPGETVGYNGTFVATEPMTIALLSLGYADGLNRALGNRFSLLVHGEYAPIIGRISMDLTTIDVTDIPNAKVGDEVVVIGRQGAKEITADDHARAVGTISWEILTRISRRVPRVED